RRLRFSDPKTSIICSPMTSLKTSIKTITYLSDTGCLEIQGASLGGNSPKPGRIIFAQRNYDMKRGHSYHQPAEKERESGCG
ncbi:hypothetical protein, partial [Escherichia coli]|uniref:hypothetical protein n=1 Tax=Escherichia coli TaxID=562 RepID=UPI001F498724